MTAAVAYLITPGATLDTRRVVAPGGVFIGTLTRTTVEVRREYRGRDGGLRYKVVPLITWSATRADKTPVVSSDGGIVTFKAVRDWADPARWSPEHYTVKAHFESLLTQREYP